MPLQVLVALVFLVSAGAVIGAYVLFAGRSAAALRKSVDDRLQEMSGGAAAPGEASLVRAEKSGALPAVDRVAGQALKVFALDRWVEQSGLRIGLGGLLLTALILGGGAAFAAAVWSHHVWAAPLGFAAGASLPVLFVRQRRASRLYRFEEHFPEALDLISRAVRAGHAFSAGLKMAADELAEPVGPELRKAFEEQNFGLSVKDALNNLAARVPILDVRFFVTAVLIQRETGGNLAEILDSLSAVVRERFKIRRQVRVHTAHGRFTGYVLLALPAFLALALSFINPEHMDALFKDRIGQTLIGAAIAMQAAGWFWIRQVVKIEV